MKTINFTLFTMLNDAARNNMPFSQLEISSAFSDFQSEIAAIMDSTMDFASAFRILGSMQIELHTLQYGIIAPNCKAGKKYDYHLGIS